MADPPFTKRQGEYLTYIYTYTLLHGEAPSQLDIAKFFGVTPPTVAGMIRRLAERGLIAYDPGVARGIRVLVPRRTLPPLEEIAETRDSSAAQGRPAQCSTLRDDRIFQVHITLDGVVPPIWRRVLIPASFTLDRVHLVIQSVMGWENYHLHQFIVGKRYIGITDGDIALWGNDLETEDEQQITLGDVLARQRSHIAYEYDFGDSWQHTLTLERKLSADPRTTYPVCIAGEGAGPPEDVGGIWGYANFLAALEDPNHPEHREFRMWVGEDFDPATFSLAKVNADLQALYQH